MRRPCSIRSIAERLGRAASTISRELKRAAATVCRMPIRHKRKPWHNVSRLIRCP
ncbi:helix-turn-helix domain-containing protein [Pseudoduganella lutea]|uniref:Transposase IS30-like HTH domain-containing protein n=1 Tax=Pseudoduganella lutea TaxID=321985 RepID=A0A4V0Z381_9BURK|nr:hypothetical protein EWM63_05670 [Pseudoduganella lutea]